jgi:hypothetical protein
MSAVLPSITTTPAAANPTAAPADLTDDQFAPALLQARASSRVAQEVLVIANKFRARIATRAPGAVWTEVGQGDVGDRTATILTAVAKAKQLFWLTIPEAHLGAVDIQSPSLTSLAAPFAARQIKTWQQAAAKATVVGGRKGEVSESTRFEVASLAGWRCQFEGCGEDLRAHLAPSAKGNYSYFAHIVASSIDGPRGDSVESALLADDASNVMLMCDKCHRLIDRVAPDRYDTPRLRAMRSANVAQVRRLLDTLRFPKAKMLVLGGNIEGQAFTFDERAAEEAMWLQSMRQADGQAAFFARNGGHLGASNSDAYWLSLFALLPTDIARFKAMREATDGGTQTALAVFPLHSTSVLALYGRLVGDSGPTRLFQFHRDQVSGAPGAQWRWPDLPRPPPDKFRVSPHREPQSNQSEAVLLINLTAAVPFSDLPTHMFTEGAFVLPTVELTVDASGPGVIGHPEDLELLGRAFDSALLTIQDKWRSRRIHVVMVAPASACFRLGQKLQARHHADVVMYERRPASQPGQRGAFAPTIEISSTKVTLLSTGASTSIS